MAAAQRGQYQTHAGTMAIIVPTAQHLSATGDDPANQAAAPGGQRTDGENYQGGPNPALQLLDPPSSSRSGRLRHDSNVLGIQGQ
ncbi:hypothetical protein BST24_06355 [Mycobacteroides franklinii]|nr:hypothetical protein BST24_06355 [Mycobacteroides franklinii]